MKDQAKPPHADPRDIAFSEFQRIALYLNVIRRRRSSGFIFHGVMDEVRIVVAFDVRTASKEVGCQD